MPMSRAFALSVNSAAIRLAETVGLDEVVNAARELGLDAPLTKVPSMALGTNEVNLLDLTVCLRFCSRRPSQAGALGHRRLRPGGRRSAFTRLPGDIRAVALSAGDDAPAARLSSSAAPAAPPGWMRAKRPARPARARTIATHGSSGSTRP